MHMNDVMVLSVSGSTALSTIGNGHGSALDAVHGTSSADETYTTTTCTSATWATADPSTASAGDLVTTDDGYWGVLRSGTATVATVDRWHRGGGSQGVEKTMIPAANAVCTIWNGSSVAAGARKVWLKRIHATADAGSGGGTVQVSLPPNATAHYTLTVPASGAEAVSITREFAAGGCLGLPLHALPFVTISDATVSADLVFAIA